MSLLFFILPLLSYLFPTGLYDYDTNDAINEIQNYKLLNPKKLPINKIQKSHIFH
jgi:hypothetical protein